MTTSEQADYSNEQLMRNWNGWKSEYRRSKAKLEADPDYQRRVYTRHTWGLLFLLSFFLILFPLAFIAERFLNAPPLVVYNLAIALAGYWAHCVTTRKANEKFKGRDK